MAAYGQQLEGIAAEVERVGTGAACKQVVAVAAVDHVVVGAAVERVVTVSAVQEVASSLAKNLVVAVSLAERARTCPAGAETGYIVARVAFHSVEPFARHDGIVAFAGLDMVGPVAAEHIVATDAA